MMKSLCIHHRDRRPRHAARLRSAPRSFRFVSALPGRSCTALAGVAVALTACTLSVAQRDAVSRFGRSSAALGDMTASQLAAAREDTIKMTIERLLLGGASKDSRLGDEARLDRGFDFDKVETITGATDALSAYGRSLLALATDSQSAPLKSAVAELRASLGRIPEAKAHVTDEQLQSIGVLIEQVGGLFIEMKRHDAVKALVVDTHGAINALCRRLETDFSKNGWVAEQLLVLEVPLLAEVTLTVAPEDSSYAERHGAGQAMRLAHDCRMRREHVIGRISEAAGAMARANDALRDAMTKSKFSFDDIQRFAERSQALSDAIAVLSGE